MFNFVSLQQLTAGSCELSGSREGKKLLL